MPQRHSSEQADEGLVAELFSISDATFVAVIAGAVPEVLIDL
jgi:hypothetical protein